jgi:hypothetical protein
MYAVKHVRNLPQTKISEHIHQVTRVTTRHLSELVQESFLIHPPAVRKIATISVTAVMGGSTRVNNTQINVKGVCASFAVAILSYAQGGGTSSMPIVNVRKSATHIRTVRLMLSLDHMRPEAVPKCLVCCRKPFIIAGKSAIA